MPDDVGGQPFANGEGPDSQDRGAADEVFAAVVLDEQFVEAAEIHEPSAAERILYAALERADSEAATDPTLLTETFPDPDFEPGLPGFAAEDEEIREGEEDEENEGRFDRSDYTRYLPDDDEPDDTPDALPDAGYGPYAATVGLTAYGAGPARRDGPPQRLWRPARWQRPVACVLAVVMGLSVVAFALIAVQRAGSGQRQEPRPSPPLIQPGDPPVVTGSGTAAPGGGSP